MSNREFVLRSAQKQEALFKPTMGSISQGRFFCIAPFVSHASLCGLVQSAFLYLHPVSHTDRCLDSRLTLSLLKFCMKLRALLYASHFTHANAKTGSLTINKSNEESKLLELNRLLGPLHCTSRYTSALLCTAPPHFG